MPEQREQNDDWNWNTQQPEKNSAAHIRLHSMDVFPATAKSGVVGVHKLNAGCDTVGADVD